MLQTKRNISPSKVVIYLIMILLIIVSLKIKRWGNAEKENSSIITADVKNYYSYLPAAFIYKDLTYSFVEGDTILQQRFWPNETKDGHKVEKMTMGMSIVYSPFFFAAHLYALNSKSYNANGYSAPYEIALIIASMFYLFLGLWFLRKLLLLYFSDWITAVTITTIFLGTNLYFYSIVEVGMSHVNSFALIAIFLYHSVSWYDKQLLWKSILIGVLGGLIVLIRPVNILILLIPLFFNIKKTKEISVRISFYRKHWLHLLTMIISGFIIILPQLIYWHYATGYWIFNSYIDETFYLNNPHILEGLFSYRKGWFVYTPLMILSTIGIPMLFRSKQAKSFAISIVVFFCINLYVQYSWWNWWYGGSFGSRPLIDSYAIMAIPLANFYQFSFQKATFKWFLSFILVCLLFLNILQTRQYRLKMIHWNGMNKETYWSVFMRFKLTKEERNEIENKITPPDINKAMKGEDEYNWDF